ncbi:DUF2306 domain-containing protein [Arthrobacter sp. R4]|uniref:DUF2306 domain-containing protein n=1 Tax=Arthrobacter sp. R4 TaxID=644417 RepID=UPI003EDAA2F3
MTTLFSPASPTTRRRRAQWPVPVGLILLSLIPVAAGAVRLTELTGGAAITPQNARFFASPAPVVIHIISVTVYSLLGAFQFVPSLRGKRGWHRTAGLILIPAGLLTALTGLWMSAFYPLPDGDTDVPLRLLFGSAMLVSIVMGVLAIRRRDYVRHSVWMTRAYAIALGAGTQALVIAPWILLAGPPSELIRALLMGLAWVINLVVAEYVIHRRARTAGPQRAPLTLGQAQRPGSTGPVRLHGRARLPQRRAPQTARQLGGDDRNELPAPVSLSD